jgi:hypothetical protein
MDAGGRAPTVGALGDAGAIAEDTKFYLDFFSWCYVLSRNPIYSINTQTRSFYSVFLRVLRVFVVIYLNPTHAL